MSTAPSFVELKARLIAELETMQQLRQRSADAHDKATLRIVELQAQLKLLEELHG